MRDKSTDMVIDTSWEARVTLDDDRRKSLYGRTRAEVAQKLVEPSARRLRAHCAKAYCRPSVFMIYAIPAPRSRSRHE